MPRLPRALRYAALLALLAALAGLPAWAEDEAKPGISFVTDLDAKTQKDLALVASAYLDPEVEFLWRPRKNFLAQLRALEAAKGVNPLVDLELMREIVYQGRHFQPRFSDKKWQRDPENDITDFKKDGPYRHLVSERFRFSYVVPKNYPKDRAFQKPPRPAAFPLLLSVHEVSDTRDAKQQSAKYPGGAVLKRHYPKDDFEDLYENWLMVAPVAARAKFLEDGAIRHRFLTGVLTNFWRRYYVDFDRIVIDGAAPAAAMAAAFPHVFAGVVLRGGEDMKIEPEVVRNYATVPVFVVGDKDLAKQLEDAGHGDVTLGTGKEAAAWMGKRHRKAPKKFQWSMLRPDHQSANWILITGPDYGAPERTLDVEVLDTDADPNTIKISATGIETLDVFLNDEIVDLDRDVRLLINGETLTYAKADRDFGRLFEKEPKVRDNMNFGWLYTQLHGDVRVPEPTVEEAPAEEPAPEEGPKGSPENEAKALKFWTKAQSLEAEGNAARAKTYYENIVKLGETSYLQRAKEKLAELE